MPVPAWLAFVCISDQRFWSLQMISLLMRNNSRNDATNQEQVCDIWKEMVVVKFQELSKA